MFLSVFGLIGGIGLSMQTGINAQLGRRAGSPFTAAMINFMVGMCALLLITLLVERSLFLPMDAIAEAPRWIFLGGVFATVLVIGNILLMPRLGSMQTAILPALGQIIMGSLIDTFGWFASMQRPLSPLRLLGIALVFAGVVLVVLARAGYLRTGCSPRSPKEPSSRSARPNRPSAPSSGALWLWRLFGVGVGMAMTAQTAVNSHLGIVLDSRLYAGVINFAVGTVIVTALHFLLLRTKRPWRREDRAPVWIWCGGLLGALYVIGNIITAQIVGTGMAVVILLTGMTIGGLLVDQFGLFRAVRRRVGSPEIIGVVIMICGAVLFYVF